jgi:hypothetical protein
MPMLNEELSEFARCIVQGKESSSKINASYQHYSLDVAIEVYRNNYRGNLHDTLAGAYPVIEQLVGKDFFRLLARKFIEQYLSHSGNLHHYGEELANFIANFEPAGELAYLPDVAALEWACHCAYFAEDAATLDFDKLAQIPSEHYPELILHVHPACQMVASRYPIAAIWQAHQPGAPCDFHIDLDSGPCSALVSRKEDIVLVSEFLDADAAWFQSIQAGTSLGAATDATLERYTDFDLQSALLNLLQTGALVEG